MGDPSPSQILQHAMREGGIDAAVDEMLESVALHAGGP
jgi:hypothetical protein